MERGGRGEGEVMERGGRGEGEGRERGGRGDGEGRERGGDKEQLVEEYRASVKGVRWNE